MSQHLPHDAGAAATDSHDEYDITTSFTEEAAPHLSEYLISCLSSLSATSSPSKLLAISTHSPSGTNQSERLKPYSRATLNCDFKLYDSAAIKLRRHGASYRIAVSNYCMPADLREQSRLRIVLSLPSVFETTPPRPSETLETEETLLNSSSVDVIIPITGPSEEQASQSECA